MTLTSQGPRKIRNLFVPYVCMPIHQYRNFNHAFVTKHRWSYHIGSMYGKFHLNFGNKCVPFQDSTRHSKFSPAAIRTLPTKQYMLRKTSFHLWYKPFARENGCCRWQRGAAFTQCSLENCLIKYSNPNFDSSAPHWRWLLAWLRCFFARRLNFHSAVPERCSH